MENKLKEVFSIVNDLLRFAEAKIAAIIAFNGATIWASLSYIKDSKFLGITSAFICLAIFNLISLIIAFWAILPIIDNDTKGGKLVEKNHNLVFFAHIATLNEESFLKAFSEKYNTPSSNEHFERDIANQIITNSRIAMKKFRFFNAAIGFTLSSIIISILVYIAVFINCGC